MGYNSPVSDPIWNGSAQAWSESVQIFDAAGSGGKLRGMRGVSAKRRINLHRLSPKLRRPVF